MAKSIRISNHLYESALADAALLHRSLAQQVEHWADVGRALEESRLDVAALKTLMGISKSASGYQDGWMDQFKRSYQDATKDAVRAGRLSPDSLRFVGQSQAAAAKVTYPVTDFDD